MTLNDTLVIDFMQAASNLLESAVAKARTENPKEFQYLECALRAGGLLSLRATLAGATGLAGLNVEVTEPDGTIHSMMSLELQKRTP